MKERPILFSAPMVRAILEGSKTQTRRVAKLVNSRSDGRGFPCLKRPGSTTVLPEIEGKFQWKPASGEPWQPYPRIYEYCPYGQSGDRLWVRETLRRRWPCWFYDADELPVSLDNDHSAAAQANAWAISKASDVCVSIHMPRWASRITLEIVAVRIERLQEISRGECMAEGCPFPNMAGQANPRAWYASLWDKINGPDSWNANPWVWVVEFRRINPQTQEVGA